MIESDVKCCFNNLEVMDMSAIDAMTAECMKDADDGSDDDGMDEADLLVNICVNSDPKPIHLLQ
jgi:hypothetical protein